MLPAGLPRIARIDLLGSTSHLHPPNRKNRVGRKPGLVPMKRAASATIIYLGPPLLKGSSSLPESQTQRTATRRGEPRTPLCLALLRMGFTKPSQSPAMLVGSYPTFSPLPCGLPEQHHVGGLFSVALSRTSRSVGVTDHPVLRSPDFPLVDCSTSDRLTNSIEES